MRIPTTIISLATAANILSAPLAQSEQFREAISGVLANPTAPTKKGDKISPEEFQEGLLVIGREIQKIINEKRIENKISLNNGELALLGALFDHSKKHPKITFDTITGIAIEFHEIRLLTSDENIIKQHTTLMNRINALLGIPKKYKSF